MNKLAIHVARYVTENYANIDNIEDVARHFAISSSTTSRYIKEITGTSFSEYLNKLRLEYAAHTLITTDKDIATIASANGFSSTSVFSRTFKCAYSMSPREYRKRNTVHIDQEVKRHIRIVADATPRTQAYTLNVSLGSVATAGIPGFIEHAVTLIKRFQIDHVRIHNLFSDFVYQRNREYERHSRSYDGYEFAFVDGLIDEFIRHGVTVDVELSNRSWSIMQTSTQDVVSVAQRPAFNSLQQVKQAAITLARHWKRRYTTKSLQGWSFDLWYDSGLSDINDYVTLLRDLRAELRDILPGCLVGGCALSAAQHTQQLSTFAMALADAQFTPDFISIGSQAHTLFTETQTNIEHMRSQAITAHSLREEILQAQSILSRHGINCQLRIHSWDPVPSQRNRYNDTSEKAAMLLQELTDCSDLPVAITYGSLTDFSSLYSDIDEPFFGGTGLVSKDGFPKPTMHAFHFLKSLPPHIIAHGAGYICACGDNRSYTLLLWNRTGLNYQFTQAKEYELTMQQIKLLYQPERETNYMVEMQHMPRNRYLLREYQVNDDEGNGVAACKRHSVNGIMPIEDHLFIDADSLPRHTARKVTVSNGNLCFQAHLAPHGFTLIKITEL